MKKIKVILADDNENIRQSIRGLLELDGDIDVIAEAVDGKDVLEKIKTMEPEVVVMDVNMPGMDGIEAAEFITENYPDIYVVMISVDDNIQNFKKAMLAGAKEYLIKPLAPDELNDTVKKVAEIGRKNKSKSQAEIPGKKISPGKAGKKESCYRMNADSPGNGNIGQHFYPSGSRESFFLCSQNSPADDEIQQQVAH
jgi:YesN/AraC family two-component response regulator